MTKFIALFALPTLIALAGSYQGVISESMCVHDHKAMNMGPDPVCIRQCVRSGKSVKFVLWDGQRAYKLSDQQTPEKFAGQKVTITGTIYPKTAILKVDKIEAVK